MSEKVLLVGGGGREDAISRKIVESGSQLFSFMKNRNPSIIKNSTSFKIGPETEPKPILKFALENRVDLAFIGPDPVLETSLTEDLASSGIRVASPDRKAARIETSKHFMRGLLTEYGIPGNIAYNVFSDAVEAASFLRANADREFAVKPLGLTGGKGVKVMGIHLMGSEEASEYASSIIRKDGSVLLEERISGEEFSLQVFTDGRNVAPMPLVQDYKMAYEGDTGPNTGGMGSISDSGHSLPFLPSDSGKKALGIMQKIVQVMASAGSPFKGVLYGQFMNTPSGIRIVEVNARFADPESMNVLHIFQGDFTRVLYGIADGGLRFNASFKHSATVLKYIVPKGYGTEPKPSQLRIDLSTEKQRNCIYYAAVSGELNLVEQSTSRSLALIGEGKTLGDAYAECESLITSVSGNFYVRHDIGSEAMIRKKMEMVRL